jgi:hypothetical protein
MTHFRLDRFRSVERIVPDRLSLAEYSTWHLESSSDDPDDPVDPEDDFRFLALLCFRVALSSGIHKAY